MNSQATHCGPDDFDIPFDWLYRGKSNKTKKSSTLPTKINKQSDNKTRSRSVSISNAALQSDNTLNNLTADQVSMTPVTKKERSSSSSSSTNRKPSITSPTSTHTHTSPSTQTPSSSSSSSSAKKSLFGSIFGKKSIPKTSTIAPATTQQNKIVIPNSSTLQQTNPNDIESPSLYPSTPFSSSSSSSSTSSSSASSTMANNSSMSSDSISGLSDIKLKRVTFSVDKFNGDPPQQLPTRKPKQGNVIIPHELVGDLPSISMGITNPLSDDPNMTMEKDSKEYKIALDNYKQLLEETAIHQQEAHVAAKRIAREVQNFICSVSSTTTATSSSNNETTSLPSQIVKPSQLQKGGIDKPLQTNTHPFKQVTNENGTEMENENENEDLTLDVIYTRCCHLREILPIPSTLRQVKGKTAPLQVLKFLNPKPTLIDILSFCDFISIVPINTIVFDNVNLSNEMFKILIKSLVNSKVLEKLSLKNVLITKENWALFCKFLLTNESLIKLDLSQTHLKFKQSDYTTNIINPSSNNDLNCLRQNLDWDLFAKVISIRQGKPIEELLLNGIKFNSLSLEKFQNILNSLTTQSSLQIHKLLNPLKCRIGLANSELSLDCLKLVLNWISSKNKISHPNVIIQGVDLAFNDLSTYVKSLVSRLSSLPFDNLEFFTLNNTNISGSYDMALILKYLSRLPNLKFLDLSNLPHLFPDVLPYIYKYLPRFSNLRRLHIDNNNLTYKQMGVICNILVKCKSITHVSMMQPSIIGPSTDASNESAIVDDNPNNTAITPPIQFAMNGLWAGLYRLVRDSPNLINLDVNYEAAPEEIQSRIALCLMRNMNKNMDTDFQLDELTVQDDLLFDGELITGGAEAIFEKLNKLISEREGEGTLIDKTSTPGDNAKKYLLKKYFENLHNVHENVIEKIDSLFEKRNCGELTMIEKENLLRFIMLDKNLAHIFKIFNHSPHLAPIINSLKLKDDFQRKHCQSSNTVNEAIDTEIYNTSPITENIQVRPHLMATDSGRTVDCLTGKPVTFRRSSTTQMQDKVYQEEEGELHKWGFFAQQQNMLYPEGTVTNAEPVLNETSTNTSIIKQQTEVSSGIVTPPCVSPAMRNKLIAKVPSGDALRAAIIKARGIDSMHDLIQNVSDEPLALESIYGDCVKVNETYDKLLNNLSANRLGK